MSILYKNARNVRLVLFRKKLDWGKCDLHVIFMQSDKTNGITEQIFPLIYIQIIKQDSYSDLHGLIQTTDPHRLMVLHNWLKLNNRRWINIMKQLFEPFVFYVQAAHQLSLRVCVFINSFHSSRIMLTH